MRKPIRPFVALFLTTALASAAVQVPGSAAPGSAAGVTLLYSNGSLNPATTATNGAVAPAGCYWSEAQHDTAVPSVANTVGFEVTQGASRRADDFTVPPGQAWTIDSFDTFAYVSTGSPAPFIGATVRVWSGPPGSSKSRIIYGDLTNRLRSSADSLVYRIYDSTGGTAVAPTTTRKVYRNNLATAGLVLTAGTYWLDWDAQAAGNAQAWAPTVTVPGTRGLPGWNARRAFTGGWGATVDGGLPASGADVPQDFPFNVNGTVSYPAPETSFGKTPRSRTTKKKVEFSFKSDQSQVSFQCSLNGAAFTPCASKVRVKSKKGKNTLSVRAVSASSVPDGSPAAYKWKYKKTRKKHPHHHGGHRPSGSGQLW
jgi:hypothetical protein